MSVLDLQVSSTRLAKHVSVVTLAGEADVYGAPAVRSEVDYAVEEGAQHLVVDLSSATLVDATMVEALLEAAERVRAGGGSLVVVCDDRRIRQTLALAGLERRLAVEASLAEALVHVAAGGRR